jgi:hypothetical protein
MSYFFSFSSCSSFIIDDSSTSVYDCICSIYDVALIPTLVGDFVK